MSKTEQGASPPAGPDSIRRNAVFALAVRLAGAVFTGGLTLFLTRYLGPGSFGVFALALSVGGLLAAPADLGIAFSSARFIAEHRSDPTQVAGILRHGLRLKLVAAGLTSLALIALAGPIASAYGTPELETPLRFMAASIFGQSFMTLFLSSFEALGRNSLGFRLAWMESAVETGASILIVLAGAGVAGAAAGRAVGYAVGAIAGLVMALRLLGRRGLRLPRPAGLSARRVATYGGALFLIDVAFSAFVQIDALLIGAILDTDAVGQFSAPVRLLTLIVYPGLALAGGLAPRLARGKDQEPNVSAFQSGLRIVLAVQFAFLAPVVVWATPITHLLFGSGYAESADVLRALGLYVVLQGPGPMLALGVNYIGEARRRIPLAIAALTINTVLDLILIPQIGIIAGAVATTVAYLVYFGGHVLICRRVVGLQLTPLVKTTLRSIAAAGAMAAVFLVFGTSSLTLWAAIAGSVLGIAAYAAVLFATREFTPDEIRTARAAARDWRERLGNG